VIELVAAVLLSVPWVRPLLFQPLPGWQTGASGNVRSAYVGNHKYAFVPQESSAWIATGVRYRDPPTADPPNATLRHLPPAAIIVWAVVIQDAKPDRSPIRLDLGRAKHFACCEGAALVGGEYELAGSGPRRAYSVMVRIYFGSHPTHTLRTQAQEALDHLRLPAPRRS
jgi:hypothetical protein